VLFVSEPENRAECINKIVVQRCIRDVISVELLEIEVNACSHVVVWANIIFWCSFLEFVVDVFAVNGLGLNLCHLFDFILVRQLLRITFISQSINTFDIELVL
jgi:hypothetical protein